MYSIRNCGGTLTLHEASGPKPRPATEPAQKSCKSGGSSPAPEEKQATDERGSWLEPIGDGRFRRVTPKESEEAEGREKLAARKVEQEADVAASSLPYYKQRQWFEKKLGIKGI